MVTKSIINILSAVYVKQIYLFKVFFSMEMHLKKLRLCKLIENDQIKTLANARRSQMTADILCNMLIIMVTFK